MRPKGDFFGKRFFKIFCRFGKNFPFFPCREFFLMLALFFVINTDGIRLMWNLPLPLFLFSSSSPQSLPPPPSLSGLSPSLNFIDLRYSIFFFFLFGSKKGIFFSLFSFTIGFQNHFFRHDIIIVIIVIAGDANFL